MPTPKILLLGDPRLYQTSTAITQDERAQLHSVVKDLHAAMMAFREQYKRGRAIAAPQIGVMKRLMYMNVDDKSTVFVNPEFTFKSPELYELWDDCMSFPELLVKVKRHKACRLKFRDLDWQEHEWELEGDLSELLQHEYDHLDGILAVMRAVDDKAFALASQKHLVGFTR
jgi:peptide deformylase